MTSTSLRSRMLGNPLLAGIAALATLLATGALVLGFDVPWHEAIGLPLLVAGLYLIAWNTHWALCYTAFAITPFGIVQQEVLGITLNLPEVLILALVAKEGFRFALRDRHLPESLPLWSLLVFVVAALVAVGTGFAHGNGTIRVLQDFRQFTEFLLLFWLVQQRVAGRDEALRLAACYVLGATLLAIHGIFQQFVPVGISPTQIASDLVLHDGIRSSSFYGATPLGGLMVLAIATACGVVLSSKRRAVNLLMGVCVVLCIVAIVYTRTRGSWLGLGMAMALLGLLLRPSRRTLLTAAVVGAVLAVMLGPVVLQRITTLVDPQRDISLMERAQYYAAAAHIGRAHPILGLGWGCYYNIDEILRAERYVHISPAEAGEDVGRIEDSTVHSAYLQLFVKTGFLGLGAFLVIVAVWVERLWRSRYSRFQTDAAYALFIGISAGIAGYLFHSAFENFFQWPVMAQSFWMLFGLSFLLAPRGETERPRYGMPVAIVGSAVLAFLVFMYACMRLETLHTDHYQRNIAKALEEGNFEKALTIARRASEVDIYEPMPHAVYARLLFRRGDTDAAYHAIELALGTVLEPPAPPKRATDHRYYFAPARLVLGEHYAANGDWDRALQQFELAGVYTDLGGEDYAEYHPLLYRAYATRGWWQRALRFGDPTEAELEMLNAASLERLAGVLEGNRSWKRLMEVASRLRQHQDYTEEADYYLGRAHLAEGDVEAAIEVLQGIPASATPRAKFYLANAYVQAGRRADALVAYHQVPGGDLYRPMALAQACALLDGDGENDTEKASREILLRAIRDEIAAMQPAPATEEKTDGDVPVLRAYRLPDPVETLGTRFPALFLWDRGPSAPDAISGTSSRRLEDGVVVELQGTGLLLQLHWVENRVAWRSVERAYPTDDMLPGWIDGGTDWFNLRTQPSLRAGSVGEESAALVLEGLGWGFSLPARIAPDVPCLLLGEVHDPAGSGRLGWQALDMANDVVTSGAMTDSEPVGGWAPRAILVPPQPEREAIRLTVQTWRIDGRIACDDLMLIELSPPADVSTRDVPAESDVAGR